MNPDTLLVIKGGEIKSAKEILISLAEDLYLDSSDIKYILDKTPIPTQMQKKLLLRNLFASVALFIRCGKSKVPPMSFKLLSEIINSKGYNTTKDSIAKVAKALRKRNIYPSYCEISILDMLTAYTPFIKEKLGFGESTEEIITKTKNILKRADEKGISKRRGPVGKIAGALYIAALLSGEHRRQKEVSEVIGTSLKTIKDIYKEMSEKLDIDALL